MRGSSPRMTSRELVRFELDQHRVHDQGGAIIGAERKGEFHRLLRGEEAPKLRESRVSDVAAVAHLIAKAQNGALLVVEQRARPPMRERVILLLRKALRQQHRLVLLELVDALGKLRRAHDRKLDEDSRR